METLKYIIDSQAYFKLLLHASKHMTVAVNGILLGTVDGSIVRIVDTVAMIHGQLGLAPLMEAALAQTEMKCKALGLTMVGYYQGNELLDDHFPDVVAVRLADKLKDSFADACLLMIDNEELEPRVLTKESAVDLWLRKKGKNSWSRQGKVEVDGAPAILPKIAREITNRATLNKFFDFDDHCDDVSRDFFNSQIKLT